MNKNIWVIANWKANKNIQEALEWLSIVGPEIPKKENLKVVVCPNFICLEQVAKEIKVGNYNLMVGSQDLSSFEIGAYTGEVPAILLSGLVSLSILGHSERRKNFNETDEVVTQKVKQIKETNIMPLVCVQDGETIVPEGCKLVAYEPVWAIGTGIPDTPENANKVAGKIKQSNGNLEVLYGGSVTSENIKSFVKQENISGVLIGGASLDANEFVKIVKECVVETP